MSCTPLKLIEIGHTGKTFGYKGELLLIIRDEIDLPIDKDDFLFLDLAGDKVPFQLESVKWANDCRIKFKGVNSLEEAKKFTSSSVLIEDERLATFDAGSKNYWMKWIEAEMRDQYNQRVGRIVDIEFHPHQTLAIVLLKDGSEKLIPLHESLIIAFDEHERYLQLTIADGLLDL